MHGYNGKVLFVDLTTGSMKEEEVGEETYRKFIGGQGLGVKILFERTKAMADPLGPGNMLGFVVGPLTGTGIHGARFQVVAKSPLTGGWGDANSGGSLAPILKAAGYDGVFFNGISPKPVYFFLDDGKAELRDAAHLWGKDTVETEQRIVDELGDKRVRVAAIGPAGEAKSLLACIRHEGSAAGRSGLGAVMGSKNIKAIAVRGTKKISMADPKRFGDLRKEYLKTVNDEHPWIAMYRAVGTTGTDSGCIEGGDAPIKNWRLYGAEKFPTYKKLDAQEVVKYLTKHHACTGCPEACKGWVKVDAYGGYDGSRLEYETVAMIGSNCLIDNVEAVGKANYLCNLMGVDTIGAGAVLAFAMECYENGLITKRDTDGIDLKWGDADAMLAMLEKICRRVGFGAILADGTRRAAERIGKGAEKYAMHVGGQDMPAHDPRVSIGMGWAYICDPTPGRHTSGIAATVGYLGLPLPESKAFAVPVASDPFDVSANAKVYAACSDVQRFWESSGLCDFSLWPDTLPMIEAMIAVTGWQDFTAAELKKAGRRIQTLRQAFNIREGVDTSKWVLPDRLTRAPDHGPFAGRSIDAKAMKERGYESLGWDPKTGRPSDSTLKELGLYAIIRKIP